MSPSRCSILLVAGCAAAFGAAPYSSVSRPLPGRVQPLGRTALGAATGGAVGPQAASLIETPANTYHQLAEKGAANSALSTAKILHASFVGGVQVGIGGLFCLTMCGNLPGLAATNPGVVKFLFGALFPVCLLLVLNSGAQLYTGNTATMSAAYWEGKISAKAVGRSWALAFLGNAAGCGAMAWAMRYAGLLTGPVAAYAAALGAGKVTASFGQQVLKGILCNYLVCMAVFLATQARDMTGRYVGILVPISCFVTSGFEHSVANLMLLPAALMAGADVSAKDMLLRNLLPVTIGNAIAGAVAIGASFSYAFGRLGEGK